MNIIVRIYHKGKLIKRLIAPRAKWKKVYSKLASAGADKWFVRVEYEKEKNHKGLEEMFFNEYEGKLLKEAKHAFSAFIEL